MKLFIKIFISIILVILFNSNLYPDTLGSLLKQDFTKQQRIKIHFEVNKRLYSFEAGKFKLKKIKKNRDKINNISEKILPWAIMEHLKPEEVARIIVYMYHADEAGASFIDAEDLIPLVAKKDIPLKDFVLMVQYNRETERAKIPEEIRQSFLGQAVDRKWDGVSILAGGRGLILARSGKLNINKTASLLLKNLPAKGARTTSQNLISIVENIIGKSSKKQNSQKIIKNFANTHKTVVKTQNSPQGLKNIIHNADQTVQQVQRIGRVKIPSTPLKNRQIDKENGIISDLEKKPSSVTSTSWKTINKAKLMKTIKPWLGTPYKYGDKTGKRGIDCSGFTRIVLIHKNIGVPSDEIGYSTSTQKNAGNPVNIKKLRCGDLIFFSASPNRSKITHVGLVTSPKTFSHSCSRGVIHDKLTKKWWRQRYVKSRRIFNRIVD